jgi:adenosine deaminase
VAALCRSLPFFISDGVEVFMELTSSSLNEFIAQLPKVELHLHLEGSIQPSTLLRIAQRNKIDLPAYTTFGIEQLFAFDNFQQFLSQFMLLARSLQYGEDFEDIAYELGQSLAEQHVCYAEVMISPAQYVLRGLDLDELVQGAAAGFARNYRESGTRVGLVFDYGRQYGIEMGWQILESAIRNRHNGVIAWSIGGDELNFPPEPFADIYSAARREGLHTMAHAGEVVGASSVWGALQNLSCERIGHGIRSIDDPELLHYLRQHEITLDISISSNVRTKAVASVDTHPIRQLYDAGLLLTLNTDDPVFFNTDLNNEYRLAARHFGFDAEQLSQFVYNAIHGSFLPKDAKVDLHSQVEQQIMQLRYFYDV